MTASSTLAAVGHGDGRWTWPLDAGEFDTTIALRGNERRAIAELGSVNLRRLQRQDALAPGWSAVRRLLRPLDAVNAALDSPPTSHRRRAMADAVDRSGHAGDAARVARARWGVEVAAGAAAVIIENETTYLTVPVPDGGIVVWGKGFEVDRVDSLPWLQGRRSNPSGGERGARPAPW